MGRATSDSAHQQHQPEKYRDLNGGLPTLAPNELPELSNVCGDGTANLVGQLQEGAGALPGVPERHAVLREESPGDAAPERGHTPQHVLAASHLLRDPILQDEDRAALRLQPCARGGHGGQHAVDALDHLRRCSRSNGVGPGPGPPLSIRRKVLERLFDGGGALGEDGDVSGQLGAGRLPLSRDPVERRRDRLRVVEQAARGLGLPHDLGRDLGQPLLDGANSRAGYREGLEVSELLADVIGSPGDFGHRDGLRRRLFRCRRRRRSLGRSGAPRRRLPPRRRQAGGQPECRQHGEHRENTSCHDVATMPLFTPSDRLHSRSRSRLIVKRN